MELVLDDVNFDDFNVRCSAISMVMADSKDNPTLTEKQAIKLKELEARDTLTASMKEELAGLIVKRENSTKTILSGSCITYLMTEYAWITQKMVSVTRELMDVPQMQKGTIVESDSLLLPSVVDGRIYKANCNKNGERERISNEFLSGEVDAYVGESIIGAEVLPDVKSIWDYPTFLCKIHEPLTLANDWQVKGYMDISKAPEGFIANCLIDTPDHIIEGLKFKLLNKLNVISEDSPAFREKWDIIERSMRFNHIPPNQRVFKKKVEPMSDIQRSALYDRVKVCREWLNNFHEIYKTLNN